jgi:disulfide reductase
VAPALPSPGVARVKCSTSRLRFSILAPSASLVEDGYVNKARLILFTVAACILLHAPLGSAAPGWLNDYKKAQQEAKADNKLLLLDFTGSDWCGYCIQLDKEVFSQSNFKEYASKNLVLLELDFPRPGGARWQAQGAELKKQNQELAQQYQVQGFPTLVVLNADGQKLWQFDGYFPGGTEALITQLEKLRKG